MSSNHYSFAKRKRMYTTTTFGGQPFSWDIMHPENFPKGAWMVSAEDVWIPRTFENGLYAWVYASAVILRFMSSQQVDTPPDEDLKIAIRNIKLCRVLTLPPTIMDVTDTHLFYGVCPHCGFWDRDSWLDRVLYAEVYSEEHLIPGVATTGTYTNHFVEYDGGDTSIIQEHSDSEMITIESTICTYCNNTVEDLSYRFYNGEMEPAFDASCIEPQEYDRLVKPVVKIRLDMDTYYMRYRLKALAHTGAFG